MNELRAKLLAGALPEGFQFSQSSLQDYLDCPRRFQLRYILRCAWPAVQSEPIQENERFLKAGALFHRMAHQLFSGVPEELIRQSIADEELRLWWDLFVEFLAQTGLSVGPGLRPEVSLSAPVALSRPIAADARPVNFRLIAKYDLIVSAAADPTTLNGEIETEAGIVIYDWKTARRRPSRAWLAERLQTRIYPYLLARAGGSLLGRSQIEPRSVEMVYWFAGPGEVPLKFPYSASQSEADHLLLLNLIAEIADTPPDGFSLTSDDRRCAYCVYRSLCEQGVRAGLAEGEEFLFSDEASEETQPDFEQIVEIEY